jgi:hypothetical protein
LNITWFSSIPPGESRNAALKQATTISFNFLSNSPDDSHLNLGRYRRIVWRKASLNTP